MLRFQGTDGAMYNRIERWQEYPAEFNCGHRTNCHRTDYLRANNYGLKCEHKSNIIVDALKRRKHN